MPNMHRMLHPSLLVSLLLLTSVSQTLSDCLSTPEVPEAATAAGFCAHVFAVGLNSPRHITSFPSGELLVVEIGSGALTLLWDDDKDGQSGPGERVTLATQSGLQGTITYHEGFIYASSATTVYRWSYPTVVRTPIGAATSVITGIPSGGHSTRPTIFGPDGLMYVDCGSASNVDASSIRSLIKRFDVSGTLPLTWASGEIYADGLRNEVGIRFDGDGVLWGVENGCDNLDREPWGDIHTNNPGEELNSFGNPLNTPAGRFYGYPYCFSEYLINEGDGAGAQWAHPNFIGDTVVLINGTTVDITDPWCKDASNVVKPSLSMPAHSAPLDILFWYGSGLPGINSGDAFVSFHGSWNRDPPQGYRVVHVSFQDRSPTAITPLFWHGNTEEYWEYRPVGLTINTCANNEACLYFTSDENNQIVVLAPGESKSSASVLGLSSVTLLLILALNVL